MVDFWLSLRDVVCVSSGRAQFILVQTMSIYAVHSFSSCWLGAFFFYLGSMIVLIFGMCMMFSVGSLYSMNLRHLRVWTIFLCADGEAFWM